MSPDVCRDVFIRGSRNCDVAFVEGSFIDAVHLHEPTSDFATLCNWLALPRLAVVDARLLTPCQLPDRPAGLDGVLLDCVTDATELCRLQTLLKALWKVPVLGSLGLLSTVRAKIDRVSGGDQPPLDVCQALGDAFVPRVRLDAILDLAAARPLEIPTIPDRDPTARASRGGPAGRGSL